jgi:hypothetical protein
MTIPQNFDLKAELKKCKTAEDLTGKNGLLQRLMGGMLEQLLQNEMDEHLGYEKHSSIGDHSGNPGNVTIATNNAGRGTDIIPSEQSLSNGGLHVILTFYPDSERVEDQAIGRAGRQGQPGSSQMIINLEDLRIDKQKTELQDEELIEVLNQTRKLKEKSQANLNIKFAETEEFLAEKTHTFFNCFQQWVSSFNQDIILESIAIKLTNFKLQENININIDKLCYADLTIANECKNLLSKETDALDWKIFLQKVVERMKKKIINDWVNLFFAPTEKQLHTDLNELNTDSEIIKQKIDNEFAKFRIFFERFLNKDGSGILVYLNDITSLLDFVQI